MSTTTSTIATATASEAAARVQRILRAHRAADLRGELAVLETDATANAEVIQRRRAELAALESPATPSALAERTADPAPVEGEQPAGETAAVWEGAPALVGAVRQLRLGRQVIPVGVLGLLWSAARIAQINPGASAAYLAVAVLVWWWKTRHSVERARRRGHRTVVTICAGLWMLVATTTGVGPWQTALLVIGGYAGAARHWLAERIPVPGEPEPVEERAPEPPLELELPDAAAPVLETIPEPEIDPVVLLWEARVAHERGPLAGATLGPPEHLPLGGLRYVISLIPGAQTSESAHAARGRIASALERSSAEVSVLPHPSGSEALAVLLLTGRSDNLLARPTPHPGWAAAWNPVKGTAAIGIHPDGDLARWSVIVPDIGLVGGTVFGDTGSGKSALLASLAAAYARTGVISVWGGDPTGGQAIPAILNHCAWPARGLEAILDQLRAAVRVLQVRTMLNGLRPNPERPGERGIPLHLPTRAEPGIVLFLDELHKITFTPWPGKAEAVRLLGTLAREGRKAAIALVGADQGPGADNFGNDMLLRTNMWSYNAVALRLSDKGAKDVIAGLEENPAKLPAFFPDGSPTYGLGYLRAATRTAPMRTFNTPDRGADLFAEAATHMPALDRVVEKAVAQWWDRRDGLSAQAAQVVELAELDPELLDTYLDGDTEMAAAVAAYRARAAAAAPPTPAPAAPAEPAAARSVAFTVRPAPLFVVPDEPATPPAPDATAGDDLSVGQARLLPLIRSGVSSPKALMARTGLSESYVHKLLAALRDAGHITKRGRGEWTAA